MGDTISVDPFEYGKFRRMFKEEKFKGQRYGQAFVTHFKLDKMTDKSISEMLWELDGKEAKDAIIKHVLFQ